MPSSRHLMNVELPPESTGQQCAFSTYLHIKRQQASQPEDLARRLLDDSREMLQDGSSLDCSGNLKFILDYAAGLSPSSSRDQKQIYELCLRRIKRSQRNCLSLDDLEDSLPINTNAEIALEIFHACARCCIGLAGDFDEVLAESTQEQFDRICDAIWDCLTPKRRSQLWLTRPSSIIKFNLRGPKWRERALRQIRDGQSKVAAEFLLESPGSDETPDVMEDILMTLLIPLQGEYLEPSHTKHIFGLVVKKKCFLDYCMGRIAISNPDSISAILAIVFWTCGHEYRRKLLKIFEKWNSLPMERLSFFANGCRMFRQIQSELALAIAKVGLGNLVVFLLDTFTMAARDKIESFLTTLTAAITAGKEWAWKTFISLPRSFLCNHVKYVKVLLDYPDRLSAAQLITYYELLLNLECPTLRSSSILPTDLAILFRKQVTNVDDQIRCYGACVLIALLRQIALPTDSLQSSDDDSDEATCSQAPKASQRTTINSEYTTFLNFLESFLTCSLHRQNSLPLEIFSQEFSTIAQNLPRELLQVIKRKSSKFFEKAFVVELNKKNQHQRFYDIDGEDALIGIEFDDHNLKGAPVNLRPLFNVVQVCEKLLHQGSLSNIDALLGCPILLTGPPRDNKMIKDWFVALVNAFYDQEDRETQEKCAKRLEMYFSTLGNDITFANENDTNTQQNQQSKAMPEEFASFIAEMQAVGISIKSPTVQAMMGWQDKYTKSNSCLSNDAIVKYIHQSNLTAELEKAISSLTTWNSRKIIELYEKLGQLPQAWKLKLAVLGEMQDRKFQFRAEMLQEIHENYVELAPLEYASLIRMRLSSTLMSLLPNEERLVAETVNYFKTKSLSSGSCEGLIDVLCSGSLKRLQQISNLLMDDNSIDIPTRIALIAAVLQNLSRVELVGLGMMVEAVALFEKIIAYGRRQGDNLAILDVVLKKSKVFLMWFNSSGLSLLQKQFLVERIVVLDLLKHLQLATRTLQILCNHVKASKKPNAKKSQALLPPLRKTMEKLIFGVRGMLQSHGCLTAFWMGNLKHRTIDGTEVDSYIHVVSSTSDDESGDDVDDDDANERKHRNNGKRRPPSSNEPASTTTFLSKDIISNSDDDGEPNPLLGEEEE